MHARSKGAKTTKKKLSRHSSGLKVLDGSIGERFKCVGNKIPINYVICLILQDIVVWEKLSAMSLLQSRCE